MSSVSPICEQRPAIHCPSCDRLVYDGQVIKSRCVDPARLTAKCRCKAWVDIRRAFFF